MRRMTFHVLSGAALRIVIPIRATQRDDNDASSLRSLPTTICMLAPESRP